MAFAKVYETEKFGQVLLKRGANEDGIPELRWFVEPPELGVCEVAVSYTDDDAGWNRCEAAFDAAVEAEAIQAAGVIWQQVGLAH